MHCFCPHIRTLVRTDPHICPHIRTVQLQSNSSPDAVLDTDRQSATQAGLFKAKNKKDHSVNRRVILPKNFSNKKMTRIGTCNNFLKLIKHIKLWTFVPIVFFFYTNMSNYLYKSISDRQGNRITTQMFKDTIWLAV